jgi:predicted SnoaL-like aldol condensation-catalyzing enzyme
MNTADQKSEVSALLRSIETGDPGPVGAINPNKYIQHNLSVGDGLAGFGAVMQQLPKGSARAKPVRVFQDGEFVFAHTEYNFFGPKIGFDVFRYENGKIVEHWDNLQEVAGPNPSGHSMTDGETRLSDLDKTDANKALVRSFVEDILVNGKMEKFAGYFDGDNYVQHNPQIPDTCSGLVGALKQLAAQGMVLKYDRIHRVLGEGNFVLAMSEGVFGGKHIAAFDLFRVHNGKIAEHWDTIEVIPPREQWKNQNGKF